MVSFDGSSGQHDTYGSALTAQPGGSQGRPSTNTSSQLIERQRPARLPCSGHPGPGDPPTSKVEPRSIEAPTNDIPVTNPIESTFATVRHRTIRSKGCLSNKTALAMVFKLVEGAQRSWRRLDGHAQLPKLILGVKFSDGLEVAAKSIRQPETAAA